MNYTIDIKGLASGESRYEFTLDRSFFESFGNDTILDADLKLDVLVNRSASWIKVDCNITGNVKVPCDRCLDDLMLPVDISVPFTVKFSSSAADDEYGDDVVVMDRYDGELDLSQIVYDYVCLSLPLKKVHPDGECNPIMLDKMKDILK